MMMDDVYRLTMTNVEEENREMYWWREEEFGLVHYASFRRYRAVFSLNFNRRLICQRKLASK